MSWESKKVNIRVPGDDRWDMCEHLKAGDIAAVVFCEDDSFGPVLRNACCKKCADEIKKKQDEELEFCHDCKTNKPGKEVNEWQWYDFYALQGDQPLHICDECWEKPTHKNRMARDQADYEAEFGCDDDDYEVDMEDDSFVEEDDYEWPDDDE